MDAIAQKRWLAQWTGATTALDEQRREDLRRLTPAQALTASETLLSLALTCAPATHRQAHSGLVEQQALLGRLRTR
jgi:hypothetical protein